LPNWRLLLDRTVGGLARLKAKGQPVPPWTLGGGTALMLHTGHRLSKDIDAFIDDPQYLTILSPRLGGEGVWECAAFEELCRRRTSRCSRVPTRGQRIFH
jgi:hypothetical protein